MSGFVGQTYMGAVAGRTSIFCPDEQACCQSFRIIKNVPAVCYCRVEESRYDVCSLGKSIQQKKRGTP